MLIFCVCYRQLDMNFFILPLFNSRRRRRKIGFIYEENHKLINIINICFVLRVYKKKGQARDEGISIKRSSTSKELKRKSSVGSSEASLIMIGSNTSPEWLCYLLSRYISFLNVCNAVMAWN